MDFSSTLFASKKFRYPGTAREFAHWLDSRSRRQWELKSIERWGLPEYGLPTIERMQDSTPMIVEYHGSRNHTYFDEHLQQNKTASLHFVGVRFVIDPLPDETVTITAECFHPAFLPLFNELMAELGQQLTDGTPASVDQGTAAQVVTTGNRTLFGYLNEIANMSGMTIKGRLYEMLKRLEAEGVQMTDTQFSEMLGSTPKTIQRYRSDFKIGL